MQVRINYSPNFQILNIKTYGRPALLKTIVDSVESELARQWNENNMQMQNELNKYLNDEQRDFSLFLIAISFVNSLNEVSSTLK